MQSMNIEVNYREKRRQSAIESSPIPRPFDLCILATGVVTIGNGWGYDS